MPRATGLKALQSEQNHSVILDFPSKLILYSVLQSNGIIFHSTSDVNEIVGHPPFPSFSNFCHPVTRELHQLPSKVFIMPTSFCNKSNPAASFAGSAVGRPLSDLSGQFPTCPSSHVFLPHPSDCLPHFSSFSSLVSLACCWKVPSLFHLQSLCLSHTLSPQVFVWLNSCPSGLNVTSQ
jgi:hypothetical protein